MKTIILTVMALTIFSQVHGQRKKTYEPVFEIPGKICKPSGIAMHEAYKGKIVFSDQQLTKEATTEAILKSSFDLSSPIYARVLTANAVENYMVYRTGQGYKKETEATNFYFYVLRCYIDTMVIVEYQRSNNSESSLYNANTWQVWINGKTDDFLWNGKHEREKINKLLPGKYKVRIEVWAGEYNHTLSIKPIAEGEFELNITAGTKLKIGKKWGDIEEGKMDVKIKEQLIKLSTEDLKQSYPSHSIKGFKILQDDYGIKKDEYKQIEFRYVTIGAYVMDKDGKCAYIKSLYKQTYMGGGRYSGSFEKWGENKMTELDCE